ncbi:ADP-ribosylglycohydrolase family protein [Actinoplanes sichuanensis]|uniref:ADP-ribosylglycohydrolase family protein n=1 Tax=Actinoplanes sichuanensis TaxID=512349 RepID=A0ABW4A4F7_9ACTN|nr:ADP-ribosylglycohydrolase family protein [Actinoplanes sichuanensis]BEL10509.1 ADP-ribosylglycohydrolase family protein [Actinoplanes sichuanensis]
MRAATGSLLGLAYGDSLGKPTEFQEYETIVARYGPGGPRQLVGEPALVTDDTQMALAVGESLREAGAITPAALEPVLRRRFLEWAASPENDRAPGMTCLRAIGNLADGRPWIQATQSGSKGCGANMRVTPVGLLPGLTDDQRSGAAQFQAALTHGHPTGLAASELTAYAVFWLRGGLAPSDLLAALRERCAEQRKVYRGDWLGELWHRPAMTSPEEFIALGWDECAAALDRVAAALSGSDHSGDPCLRTGAGWIAEEALATALYVYLISPDEPVAVLGRGAASSGDSDSIACLAGAFAGAALGLTAWPADWQTQIEYADRLFRLGTAWD